MGPTGRRVVLHVGAHKTGTTVVQQYLGSHRRTLSRHRVRYVPRTELTPLVGWGEIVVNRPELFGALLDDFARGRRHRTLLASHENVCGHPFRPGRPGLYPAAGDPVDALRALLAPFDVTVVVSIRPQDELLESYYLQTVHLGGRIPFPAWLAGVDLTELSWLPLVTRLRSAFGPESVVLVDFRRIRAGSAAYVSHLLQRVALDVPVDASWERPMNPSVSGQGLQMALRGNAVLQDPADRAALRGFLQRNFSHARSGRAQLLDADTRADLRRRYRAEYEALVAAPPDDLATAS